LGKTRVKRKKGSCVQPRYCPHWGEKEGVKHFFQAGKEEVAEESEKGVMPKELDGGRGES